MFRHYSITRKAFNPHLKNAFLTAYATMVKYYTVLLLGTKDTIDDNSERQLALQIHYSMSFFQNSLNYQNPFSAAKPEAYDNLSKAISEASFKELDQAVILFYESDREYYKNYPGLQSYLIELSEYYIELEG